MATGIGQPCLVTKSRIDYFDIAKGFGIILVIIAHTGFATDYLSCYINSFHMPLFFILSGMLSNYLNEIDMELRPLVLKKIRGLMIPYISFSILYVVIYTVTYYMGLVTKEDFLQSVIYMITLYGDSTLWFLPALLIGYTVFYFLQRKLKGFWVLAFSMALALLSYLIQTLITPIWARNADNLFITNLIDFARGFLRGFIVASFICLGYFIYQYVIRYACPADWNSNDSINRNDEEGLYSNVRSVESYSGDMFIKRVKTLAIGIGLLLVTAFLCRINTTVDFHRLVLGNVIFFYINAVLGSVGLIFVCMAIRNLKVISFFGRNSLVIMCTHLNFYILFAAINIAWIVNNYVTRAKSYVFMAVIVVSALLMETILIIIINRFFPFILGKKNRRFPE